MDSIDEKLVAKGAGSFTIEFCMCHSVYSSHPDRQGDCYKCIQFALCACAGLSFFVQRFSACLVQLCGLCSEGSSSTFETATSLNLAVGLPVHTPLSNETVIPQACSWETGRNVASSTTSNVVLAIDIETGADELGFPASHSQTITALTDVCDDNSMNAETGFAIAPARSLSAAVLERIEMNKQAALQRRKAAENAAKSQRQNECVTSVAAAAPHDAGFQSASAVLQPSAIISDANQLKRSTKRHWITLGAVSDDGNDS